MDWTPVASLRLLWWNTSLSPPIASKKSTKEDLDFVVSQIKEIRANAQIDVLGLGEVCSEDIEAILDGVADPTLKASDTTSHSGSLKFDTAVIYDHTKLAHIDSQHCVEVFGKNSLKLALIVRFQSLDTADIIDIAVSHWPSRLTSGEMEAKRAELGMLLRCSLKKIYSGGSEDPYTILMGDYNDEPCSPSIEKHLLATRDRALAKRNNGFFYNPFWRCLGESLPNSTLNGNDSICGTHYYRSGTHSEWFTYDQIIFSSAFLGNGSVVLNEELCCILSNSELKKRLLDRNKTSDHYPVLSAITLRSKM